MIFNNDKVEFNDYEINLINENQYLIKYNDFKLLISDNTETNNSDKNDISIIVIDDTTQIETDKKQQITFDNKKSNAYIIKAKSNGEFSIRRMTNALRE